MQKLKLDTDMFGTPHDERSNMSHTPIKALSGHVEHWYPSMHLGATVGFTRGWLCT